jgi:hypothetical protein
METTSTSARGAEGSPSLQDPFMPAALQSLCLRAATNLVGNPPASPVLRCPIDGDPDKGPGPPTGLLTE